MRTFGSHIVFVDESGDHSLSAIDPDYPVFVLACCLIEKQAYIRELVPTLQAFKFKHFGHDAVVLHERDIRRDLKSFAFLKNKERKAAFSDELTGILAAAPLRVFAAVIDKRRLAERGRSENPYELSLRFCLERMYDCLSNEAHLGGMTHVVCEARGKQEDADLELSFRRICDGDNYNRIRLPFEPVIVDKRANATGLQLADLVARPIGLHALKPAQPNRAWDVVEGKLHRSPDGRIEGYGLKSFP